MTLTPLPPLRRVLPRLRGGPPPPASPGTPPTARGPPPPASPGTPPTSRGPPPPASPGTPPTSRGREGLRCRLALELFIERLTWTDVEAALGRGIRRAIVCAASTEQHGPHLPE